MGTYINFAPLKKPQKRCKRGQKRTTFDEKRSKKRSKSSTFRLTHLHIRGTNHPSRARNKDQNSKKRAFARFGEVKIDVSVMQHAACSGNAEPKMPQAAAARLLNIAAAAPVAARTGAWQHDAEPAAALAGAGAE